MEPSPVTPTAIDLRLPLRNFVFNDLLWSEALPLRRSQSATERLHELLLDPQFQRRVAPYIPGLLSEWTSDTSSEVTGRMCDLASRAPNPESVGTLLYMYQRTHRDYETILGALANYHQLRELHGVFFLEVRRKRSPAVAHVCMRALCSCWPAKAAELFGDFLDFTSLDEAAISELIRNISLANRKKFLDRVRLDGRVQQALKEHPL